MLSRHVHALLLPSILVVFALIGLVLLYSELHKAALRRKSMGSPIKFPDSKDRSVKPARKRITLVLFRTRRRDKCSRLKEGVRRRVRKSRQKEAAGAADAGLMQIEWSERGVLKLAGVVTGAEEEVGGRVGAGVDGGRR